MNTDNVDRGGSSPQPSLDLLGNADAEALLHWLKEEENRFLDAAQKAVARAENAAARRAMLLRALGLSRKGEQ